MADNPQNLPAPLLEELYHFNEQFQRKISVINAIIYFLFIVGFIGGFIWSFIWKPSIFIVSFGLPFVANLLIKLFPRERFLKEYEENFIVKVIPILFPGLVYEIRTICNTPTIFGAARFKGFQQQDFYQPQKSFLIKGQLQHVAVELSQTIVLKKSKRSIRTAFFKGLYLCVKTNLTEDELLHLVHSSEMQAAFEAINNRYKNNIKYTYIGDGICIFDIYINKKKLLLLDLPLQNTLSAKIDFLKQELDLVLAPASILDNYIQDKSL